MEEQYIKKIMSAVIFIILGVLSFLILKPILISIIVGLILAFIFFPVYNLLYEKTKMENFSAALVCIALILLILLPIWFLTPIFINQSVKFYLASQQIDLTNPLQKIFPSLFSSEQFSSEVGTIIQKFVTNSTNYIVKAFADIVLNFPTFFLQLVVVFFVFFFVLRDKDKLINYIKSLLPFSKEIEEKLFKHSRDITMSVIYGQVVIGVIQGLIAGIGFFIFGVPNALLLTLLASIAGIFPIIGTTIIWVPVAIYLLVAGTTFPAVGVTIFGLLSSFVENFIRPIFVARRTSISSSILLIGMVGGFFLFGVLGFILGPLILAYLLVILEIYRNKKTPGPLIKNPNGK